nr:uncharacterized protein CTRU02_14088 [Colletotrichum truncatum]KAF6782607.1 hypothetical protein CTRU02_14088 [Colletotrichum truncatum]
MAATAWGWADAGLTIYSLLSSWFPGSAGGAASTVRIYAGINDAGTSQGKDGVIKNIQLYDINQSLIGNGGANQGWIGSGLYKDYRISQVDNRQATFAQIFATNDAICIPVATITWPDGTPSAWIGDFGWHCGLEWHYGKVWISGKTPRCTWIDADHTNNIRATMLMIGWPYNDPEKSGSPSCGYPAFRAYNGGSGIVKREGPVVGPRKKDPRLIISSIPSHNATELCLSETSRGPDLVSLEEGVYCNMETRELLPLCGGDIITDCYDVTDKLSHKG